MDLIKKGKVEKFEKGLELFPTKTLWFLTTPDESKKDPRGGKRVGGGTIDRRAPNKTASKKKGALKEKKNRGRKQKGFIERTQTDDEKQNKEKRLRLCARTKKKKPICLTPLERIMNDIGPSQKKTLARTVWLPHNKNLGTAWGGEKGRKEAKQSGENSNWVKSQAIKDLKKNGP